jgi:hypothetical protein
LCAALIEGKFGASQTSGVVRALPFGG